MLIFLQDSTGQWRALPYEIAHALVRSVILHCRKWAEAQEASHEALRDDPSARKPRTRELQAQLLLFRDARRYIVFNRRTGHAATQEWMATHMKIQDGKPVPKRENQRAPWMASYRFRATGQLVKLHLALDDGEPERPVRCLELQSNEEREQVQDIIDGYQHLDVDEEFASASSMLVFIVQILTCRKLLLPKLLEQTHAPRHEAYPTQFLC